MQLTNLLKTSQENFLSCDILIMPPILLLYYLCPCVAHILQRKLWLCDELSS